MPEGTFSHNPEHRKELQAPQPGNESPRQQVDLRPNSAPKDMSIGSSDDENMRVFDALQRQEKEPNSASNILKLALEDIKKSVIKDGEDFEYHTDGVVSDVQGIIDAMWNANVAGGNQFAVNVTERFADRVIQDIIRGVQKVAREKNIKTPNIQLVKRIPKGKNVGTLTITLPS